MSGNGVDSGTVYALLREVANRVVGLSEQVTGLERSVAGLERKSATKQDVAGLRAEIQGDVSGLRQAVTAYHASVMGHGILISELDERPRRVERRLDMGVPS